MAISIGELLGRAQSDAAFLAQLSANPLGTAQAAGLQVTSADLKALLRIPGATDAELVEVLQQRLAHARASSGCGLCGD
ncbi:MAG TPA: Os1348 family NHLP clan protein [Chloroflexota bacterium]|nr:Os1348 family NHLP clan protein [Chloroflexota bacterium]